MRRTRPSQILAIAVVFLLLATACVSTLERHPPGAAARGAVESTSPRPTQDQGSDPPLSASGYDEQLGLTFTQSYTSMEYNVTAVEQTDPILDDGPAYLLNGVSSTGFWYQVGVSWDWAPGNNPGNGFDMNYEVYDTSGNSVFPTNGQGGLDSFSGAVNQGDLILLNLYFSNSSSSVVMSAEDTNTSSKASEVYSSMGATYFSGFPDAIADQNGYFTGLMTEWYHGGPYYSNQLEVRYSNLLSPLASGWMWMDEFNAQTDASTFSASTQAPVTYTNPTGLQEFSYNGTTEYSDAYEFITGALANSGRASQVPLTLSFTTTGGSGGLGVYSPPSLSYVSGGMLRSALLTATPTVYEADLGSTWTVSKVLNGSTTSERWETTQAISGIANSSLTLQFDYFEQVYVVFAYSVAGIASGPHPPDITYTFFGTPATTEAGTNVWADAGSRYQYSDVLAGSNSSVRLYTKSGGSLGDSRTINATYYPQDLVEFQISFKNSQVLPGLRLDSTSAGDPYSDTLGAGSNRVWLDSGSSYSLPQTLALASGDRLFTGGNWTGRVSADQVVPLDYVRQFYLTISPNVSGGGVLSPASGWYSSGSRVQLEARAWAGWMFEGWDGVGTDSVSSSNRTLILTIGPSASAQETAVFYAGVTISATGPGAVSYSDSSVSGTVPAGATVAVYVDPSSTLTLTSSGAGPLTTFEGWSGASNSTNATTRLSVNGPMNVVSRSVYNYLDIGVLAIVIALAVVAVVLVVTRRRPGLKPESPEHRSPPAPPQ